ncbi:hypothetical protein EPUS_00327 [Endocarpon pusillum Z07020]|uniref:Uncharacterized protein n=1 Tax=Endocarpon pusillum (strain Z07020 / HMAS-L-300199) TaxID=1263415 RepID=U1HIY2_ENDPU|nr:uncharacterized protein EPUS_00327 [Endocarpon pusillum Z07020]ERF70140.1 hypothetical protein EPUS_00327 [Endocarpon pusillum Z07020]
MTTQKTVLVLEGPKDWDDWYEIVRRTARVQGIFHLVDISAAIAPRPPTRPEKPTYKDINPIAESYAALNDAEKDHYKVLQTEYRTDLARYDQDRIAVRDIIYHIQDTTARGAFRPISAAWIPRMRFSKR